MVTVKINGKKYLCPESWRETTTDLFQRVKGIKEPTYLSIFNVLMNSAYKEVANEKAMAGISQAIDYFFTESEYFRKTSVDRLHLNDGTIILIPKKIEAMTIEQNLLLRQCLLGKVAEESISMACAIALQPYLDRSVFDADRVDHWDNQIKKLSIVETFPLGFFLCRKQLRYGKNGLLSLLIKWMKIIWQRPMKTWRALKS